MINAATIELMRDYSGLILTCYRFSTDLAVIINAHVYKPSVFIYCIIIFQHMSCVRNQCVNAVRKL